jgi:hypothetical protein
MPKSRIGNRQRHWPCNPALNHATHSDHSCGHRHVAILGSPVYECDLHTAIVTEEPFFVTISFCVPPQPTEAFS